MRHTLAVAAAVGFGLLALAQPAAKRYTIDANLDRYPQATPKDTLRSVLKAAQDDRRIDYLMAHLMEPTFVDGRLKAAFAGQFDKLVAEAATKFRDDPESLVLLRRFLTDGTFEESGDEATAKLADVKGRVVYFKKAGDRWYLEDRNKPSVKK